jgi:hypothetical protein
MGSGSFFDMPLQVLGSSSGFRGEIELWSWAVPSKDVAINYTPHSKTPPDFKLCKSYYHNIRVLRRILIDCGSGGGVQSLVVGVTLPATANSETEIPTRTWKLEFGRFRSRFRNPDPDFWKLGENHLELRVAIEKQLFCLGGLIFAGGLPLEGAQIVNQAYKILDGIIFADGLPPEGARTVNRA